MSTTSRSSSRRADIIRIERPSSVDPKQPNISYRIPKVSDYHSRCTQSFDEIHFQNCFELPPCQVTLLELSPDNNRRHAAANTVRPLAIGPKTQFSKKFIQKTIGSRKSYNIPEDRLRVVSPRSQVVMQESQGLISQKERVETEWSYIDKTRLTKRLAQIVPHRIDQPYFMAGRNANLSRRYTSSSSSFAHLSQLSRNAHSHNNKSGRITSIDVDNVTGDAQKSFRYEVNEEEFEKLRLRADSRNSSSGSWRRSSKAGRRSNTPTQFGRENEDGKMYKQHEMNSKQGDIEEDQTQQDLTNGKDDGGNKKQSGATDQLILRPKPKKIITVGNYSEGKDNILSLANSVDFSQLDPFDLCIANNKQIRAFEGMFQDIDFDKNRKVTFKELMHRMFSNVSKKDAKFLMKIFDINKDTTIDRREFIAICALNDKICGLKTESRDDSLRLDLQSLSELLIRYKELFAFLDQDDNSQIHTDELMLIMTTAMGKEIGMNETIAKSIIDAIDKQRFGYIDFVSFLMFIPFFLKLYKSMLDSNEIELGELEEARIQIRKQLKASARRSGRVR
eukprot:gene18858-20758_t